jgi:RNA polymerase sigma factor (sigma-70 family)
MCFGLTKDEEAINDAVQELMLYFLQMNPETLKNIYDKDGEDGIIRYGAVVLKRSLTSVRSPFYYKYRKYYKNLVGMTHKNTSSSYDKIQNEYHNSIYNMPEQDQTEEAKWEKLERIDLILEKFHWYEKRMFELYYTEKNTFDSIAEKTGISRNHIFTTIQNTRNKIIKKIENE